MKLTIEQLYELQDYLEALDEEVGIGEDAYHDISKAIDIARNNIRADEELTIRQLRIDRGLALNKLLIKE